jgi:hypothetical protein
MIIRNGRVLQRTRPLLVTATSWNSPGNPAPLSEDRPNYGFRRLPAWSGRCVSADPATLLTLAGVFGFRSKALAFDPTGRDVSSFLRFAITQVYDPRFVLSAA